MEAPAARHRWPVPRIVSVEVGDAPEAWRRAGFFVDARGDCNIGGVSFRLLGGSTRGVLRCTVEAELALAPPEGDVEVNGFTYHVQAPGTAPPAAASAEPHACTATGILKLEICPLEAWDSLTKMVHRVLPPPFTARTRCVGVRRARTSMRRARTSTSITSSTASSTRASSWAFANKNPDGKPQHVALWRMQGMEVFEMADNMGTRRDEMKMFFFVVADLEAAVAAVGKDNCSPIFEQSPGRRAVILSQRKLGISVRTFLVEPPPPAAKASKL